MLQCLLLGLGAIPLYRFAARRLSPPLAVLVALSYLVYPPMHGAQFFDFHFQPVAAAFVLAAMDAFDAKRMRTFWLFCIIALGCREDVSIGLAVLGILLVFSGHRAKEGAIVAAVSGLYFVAIRFILMPAIGAWALADLYKDLVPPGDAGFVGIVKTLATNPLFTLRTLLPEKLRYTLQILAPLAFLPLRRRWLAVWLIQARSSPCSRPAMVRRSTSAFTTGASASPTSSLPWRWRSRSSAPGEEGWLAATGGRRHAAPGVVHRHRNWAPSPATRLSFELRSVISFAPPTAQERRRLKALDEAMRLVPKKAILAASDRELPHVSNRIESWNLAVGTEGADYAIYTKIDPSRPIAPRSRRHRPLAGSPSTIPPKSGCSSGPARPPSSRLRVDQQATRPAAPGRRIQLARRRRR